MLAVPCTADFVVISESVETARWLCISGLTATNGLREIQGLMWSTDGMAVAASRRHDVH